MQYFRYFVIIPWKWLGPSFERKKECFVPSWVWNWLTGSEEEDENVKNSQTDRRTDGQTTDNGQQAIRKSSLELSTQVSLKGIGWKAETYSKYVSICQFLYQGINSYRIRWGKKTWTMSMEFLIHKTTIRKRILFRRCIGIL